MTVVDTAAIITDERTDTGVQYLDALQPSSCTLGYGELGAGGLLGYEDKHVRAGGRAWPHAVSAHSPSRICYALGACWGRFRCRVGINDDVPAGMSQADFAVYGDGRLLARAERVRARSSPRTLEADVTGVDTLELVVTSSRWEYSHTVWLDPVLDVRPFPERRQISDCLARVEITLPRTPIRAARCIATVASRGFSGLLDDMLGSIVANCGCDGARLVVFVLDADAECCRVAGRWGADVIECTPRVGVNATIKSILYSVARVVDADAYLCLDADTLVLESLEPVFAAVAACGESSVFATREGNGCEGTTLGEMFTTIYRARPDDLARITGSTGWEGRYPLIVNDGVFAGSREALLNLDETIRGWTTAPAWVDERRDIWWRNQAIFNLALAHGQCGVELAASFNLQLHTQQASLAWQGGRVHAEWNGRPIRVLHFSGRGRKAHPAWRGLFGRVAGPLVPDGAPDLFDEFKRALRGWVGTRGVNALTWSFYGARDGRHAQVRDPRVFSLFGTLHYLIRSSGCARVLEAGTAKGVSAACMAAAVAGRTDAAVVTLDIQDDQDRAALWSALPDAAARCIEERRGDSIALMRDAIARGERYDAALLDTTHDETRVFAEFECATRLVRDNGLILIHDVQLPSGSVDAALRRIEASGYGVSRLWSTEYGVADDDGLGLALITNREVVVFRDTRPLKSELARRSRGSGESPVVPARTTH
ncbi:MAG: Alpha-galactosidase [Gemmatimonadetes bacterium]|nr:Alpha-galactosidase [Gemmatimonadota bacterium]